MIYLAIPYTFNPELSFDISKRVTAKLMEEEGKVVYSPIVHSHPVCEHLPKELQLDHNFWMSQDLPILERCDELMVVNIEGIADKPGYQLIQDSRGVRAEVQHAIKHSIPIKYYHYDVREIQQAQWYKSIQESLVNGAGVVESGHTSTGLPDDSGTL